MVMMYFTIIISAPFLEEVFFRGIIQEYISKNKKLAFAISWFIFAFMHVLFEKNPINFWYYFSMYGTASFILCWYYYKSQSLGKVIILHSFSNFLSIIIVALIRYFM